MNAASSRRDSARASRFWWRGALILLPVLALAAVGGWALRQDRLVAEQEAKERAQTLADEVARRIMAAFFPQENGNPRLAQIFHQPPRATNIYVFTWRKIDRTIGPVPINLVPTPDPLDFSLLTDLQLELWRKLDATQGSSPEGAESIKQAQTFIDTQPPRRFAALAEYRCGTMELAQANTNAAVAAFEKALVLSSNVMTEAGLPLKQLAQLRLLELWPMEKIEKVRELAEAENRARGIPPIREIWPHPWVIQAQDSLVSPWLAEAADHRGLPQSIAKIILCGDQFISTKTPHQDFWRHRLRTVELAEAACSRLGASPSVEIPRFLWFCSEGDWLATRVDLWANTTSEWSVCYCMPQPVVNDLVCRSLANSEPLPSWCSVSVVIAGHPATPEGGWQIRSTRTESNTKKPSDLWTITASTSVVAESQWQTLRATIALQPVKTPNPKVLAVAAPIANAPELQVRVHFADPAAFYTRLRQRAIWFGSLIGGSTLAALVGLVAAQRAFQKQQRLAEMKSNFVSSVSHELRAPIASVRLMSESLERGKITEPAKQQEYFRFIGQECRRLSALIENVLDFARIEQGRKQYEFEPTDVVALVRSSAQLMEPAAREQGIKLEMNLDEASLVALNPPPNLDSRAIQQALVNLLDNAIKYSPPNGARNSSSALEGFPLSHIPPERTWTSALRWRRGYGLDQ